ncbi:MAG: hypothetical protein FJ029_11220 [Actinobacteria bacterium]|nr:hypothetical protein [Actinomycetota bacterium]
MTLTDAMIREAHRVPEHDMRACICGGTNQYVVGTAMPQSADCGVAPQR